jgi:hypothetical protein
MGYRSSAEGKLVRGGFDGLLSSFQSLTLLIEIRVLTFDLLLLGIELFVLSVDLLSILEEFLVLFEDAALDIELVLEDLVLPGDIFAECSVVNRRVRGIDGKGRRGGGRGGIRIGAALAECWDCRGSSYQENAGGEKTHCGTSGQKSLKISKTVTKTILSSLVFRLRPSYFADYEFEQKRSFTICHFWVRWKKSKDLGKKVEGAGKELPEVLRKVQKLWNRIVDTGDLWAVQSSIVERMRAAAVVARATACDGIIF